MRRLVFPVTGSPRIDAADRPEPGPGQIAVHIEALGVSVALIRLLAAATEQSEQAEQPGPSGPRPGGELVGTVTAVGPGGTRFAVGDRVGGIAADIFAECVLCDPALLTSVPPDVSAADALALVRGGLIALSALRAGGFRPGESVLVTAAASGTGHLALQLARALGASRVTAVLTRTAAKVALAEDCGADVHDYADADWGAPVDLGLDAAGGTATRRALESVAARGRLVAFAAASGPIETSALLPGLKTVTGFSIGLLSREDPDELDRRRAELWSLHAAGQLRPAHTEFAFARITDALDLVASRAGAGRVVLRPDR